MAAFPVDSEVAASVNDSRVSTYVLGVILIFVGTGILFNNLNIFHFDFGSFIVPMILAFIGIKLLDRGKRTAGGILLGIAVLLFLGAFGIHIGNVIGLAFSLAVIYFGYRMMRSKKKEFKIPSTFERQDGQKEWAQEERGMSGERTTEPFQPEREMADQSERESDYQDRDRFDKRSEESFRSEQKQRIEWEQADDDSSYNNQAPKVKHSLIGNLYLTAPRWELTDMNIWHGFGDVKIDLSRALVHDTETVLIINGWIGDIDIYVPYDLEVAFTAHVNIGDIDIFGNKEGGINRNVSIETPHYRDSSKRVRIIVNLLIGDVDVIYV